MNDLILSTCQAPAAMRTATPTQTIASCGDLQREATTASAIASSLATRATVQTSMRRPRAITEGDIFATLHDGPKSRIW